MHIILALHNCWHWCVGWTIYKGRGLFKSNHIFPFPVVWKNYKNLFFFHSLRFLKFTILKTLNSWLWSRPVTPADDTGRHTHRPGMTGAPSPPSFIWDTFKKRLSEFYELFIHFSTLIYQKTQISWLVNFGEAGFFLKTFRRLIIWHILL